MLIKRRKNKRFPVKVSAFTTLGPHFTILGEIVDISRSGLSFCYISEKHPTEVAAVSDTFLHIFSSDMSFSLLGVPIKAVSDFEMKNKIAFNPMWRRGVEFGKMTEGQKSQLEYFIQNCTTEEVIVTVRLAQRGVCWSNLSAVPV